MNLPHRGRRKIFRAEKIEKRARFCSTRSRRSDAMNPRLSPAQGGWLAPPRRVLNACTSQGNLLSRTDSSQPIPSAVTNLKVCMPES